MLKRLLAKLFKTTRTEYDNNFRRTSNFRYHDVCM